MIDGNIPNIISGKSTLAYKCIINDAKARTDFELQYFDEEDYPCCAQ